MDRKRSDRKKSPRRVPSPSPRTGRRTQRYGFRSGKRTVRINRGIVSTVETEESADDEEDDKYRPISETPPLDFDSEDDSEDEYEGDGGNDAIEIPCFRVVVTRNKTPASDSESESEGSTDSDVEP